MSVLALVVDASTAVKVFVPDSLSAKAMAVIGLLRQTPPARLHVPGLFFAECANVLWKCARFQDYAAADARTDIRELGALAWRVTPTQQLCERALDLAMEYEISAYDACYVALAEHENATHVTADRRLVRKFAGAQPVVQWLGDFEAPAAPAKSRP
jgi:predicted nucleic acid-binding protein